MFPAALRLPDVWGGKGRPRANISLKRGTLNRQKQKRRPMTPSLESSDHETLGYYLDCDAHIDFVRHP